MNVNRNEISIIMSALHHRKLDIEEFKKYLELDRAGDNTALINLYAKKLRDIVEIMDKLE